MIYIGLFLVLYFAELMYFRVAKRYNIVDIPNNRSSHTQVTIRGGGVIYWVAAILYLSLYFSNESFLFFIGLTFISIISFVDDVYEVKPQKRFLFQIIAISFIFILTGSFNLFPIWKIISGYIILIGILNAYNFMDGINGITGLYTISILIPLQYINLTLTSPFVNPDAIWFPLIASFVFLFFNFRNKAKCFAGDVGSVTIAFWIVTLLILLVIKTNKIIWIGFLAVYGVDSVMTIFHRIWRKENIMKAHRLHFYQILVNEYKLSHLIVSSLYFGIQFICSALIIFFYPVYGYWVLITITLLLTSLYMTKFKLMKVSNVK